MVKLLYPQVRREKENQHLLNCYSLYRCEEQSKRTTEVNGCTFSAKKRYSRSKHFMYVLIKISGNFGSLVSFSAIVFQIDDTVTVVPAFPRFQAGKVTVNIKSTVKSAF